MLKAVIICLSQDDNVVLSLCVNYSTQIYKINYSVGKFGIHVFILVLEIEAVMKIGTVYLS